MDIYYRESGTGMTYNNLVFNYWRWKKLSVTDDGVVTGEVHFFDSLERATDQTGFINSRTIVWQLGVGDDIGSGVAYLELLENYTTDDQLVLTLKDSIKV